MALSFHDKSTNSRHIEGQLGYYSLAGETSISEGTAEAAWASANVALSAAEILNQGEKSAFALCRPPGHHASHDQYGGYCFINNAAIAAQNCALMVQKGSNFRC